MKLLLYLLLLNLLFIFISSQIEDNFDSSTEILLNKKEFEKYLKSFNKVKRFFRILQEDTSESEESEDSEDNSSSSFQELSDITDHSEGSSFEESNESSGSEEPSEIDESNESSGSVEQSESEEPSESSGSEEQSESEEPSESSGGEEQSESEEPSESSGSEEQSESEEPSESSGSEEQSESEESSESGESNESEESSIDESTETKDTTTTDTSTTIETTTDTSTTIDTTKDTSPTIDTSSNYNDTQTESPTRPEQKKPQIGIHISLIHILLFTRFRYALWPRPIIITFTLFISFRGISPFHRITFTLRIVFILLRELQNTEQNNTDLNNNEQESLAVCTLESVDETSRVAKYTCQAESEREPAQVISYNNFLFDGKEYQIGEDINFSPEAAQSTSNLQNQNADIDRVILLNQGEIFNNDTSSFSVKGKLGGVNVDKILFSFYDTSNGERKGVDIDCNVLNKAEEDFQLKCEPETNLTGYIYESNGTYDNHTGIILNMSEYKDFVNIEKVSNPSFAHYYKTNSSGLSGGAIAGIVIACAFILMLITLILLCLRRRKRDDNENNSSSVVGLRTIENYNE